MERCRDDMGRMNELHAAYRTHLHETEYEQNDDDERADEQTDENQREREKRIVDANGNGKLNASVLSADRTLRTRGERRFLIALRQCRRLTVMNVIRAYASRTQRTLTVKIESAGTDLFVAVAQTPATFGRQRAVRAQFGVHAQWAEFLHAELVRTALARLGQRRAFVQRRVRALPVARRVNGLLEFDAQMKGVQ